ncbi:SDR family NAD(P)-dependent oxidoreductase [Nocardioides sp.]|uniref:SDR family NAD(P)-dependent oxidoreductase n=1 Tax=Nocardioides sp. TaxID=35761 RepID=UPI002CAE88D0|nr:SDR family NAD(P)-dependent oxidoreductase [Nocardioides sp.]HXH79258.1 SDR family NAD(P)-dependent oxidoreductase [Nocardioides sp.]
MTNTQASSSTPSTTDAPVWFITGTSSGIGRELALLALRQGDRVAALSRTGGSSRELVDEFGPQVLVLDVDVRDAGAVQRAVDLTVAAYGRIDVVANNAGYGLFGSVEEVTDEQARAIFDTNVFGVLNVLRATLPILRSQGSGHVLQGSSVYGQAAHPGVGLLSATKHAVEGLSDALAAELAPLGISVTLVEPGFTATAFLANLDVAAPISDYDQTVRVAQQAIASAPASAFSNPADVAALVLGLVGSGAPPVRFAVGTGAVETIGQALSDRLAQLHGTGTTAAA